MTSTDSDLLARIRAAEGFEDVPDGWRFADQIADYDPCRRPPVDPDDRHDWLWALALAVLGGGLLAWIGGLYLWSVW